MFPPLSRYPFWDADGFVAFGGAGIVAIDDAFGGGTVWFADYFRHRLGRQDRRY